MGPDLTPPQPLNSQHEFAHFSCGIDVLDSWLLNRARMNQASGASRVYVACRNMRVVAYYSLSSASITNASASGRFRRNMPDPIPVIVLGRLAVDASLHGLGVGRSLFRDAAYRVLNAAEIVGVRGLIVHALTQDAKTFYLRLGLSPSPVEPMMLMITLDDLRHALG